MIDRNKAVELVSACVREAVAQGGDAVEVTEETVLVGPGAVIGSIGVVSLIVDIEQRLEMDHGLVVTLANDKAMSQRSSPFRTTGVLADHILAVLSEGAGA